MKFELCFVTCIQTLGFEVMAQVNGPQEFVVIIYCHLPLIEAPFMGPLVGFKLQTL